MASKNKTIGQYTFAKSFFSYGIPTTVLCLIIFILITKVPMTLGMISNDLFITAFVTEFICVLTLVPGIHSDMKKGKTPKTLIPKDKHPLFKIFSKNIVLFSLEFAFFAMMIFAFIPGGIASLISSYGLSVEIPAIAWAIIKGLYVGFMTVLTTAFGTFALASDESFYSKLTN